ncbi:hypothetical protein AB0442_28610 [Kitasatospora sp. NPDC085895]|uniref:hypothetical protein n=1 Tax=Kitasatospora sp. NPDC085895 TaxID=3155057 RepID=UPI00344CB949
MTTIAPYIRDAQARADALARAMDPFGSRSFLHSLAVSTGGYFTPPMLASYTSPVLEQIEQTRAMLSAFRVPAHTPSDWHTHFETFRQRLDIAKVQANAGGRPDATADTDDQDEPLVRVNAKLAGRSHEDLGVLLAVITTQVFCTLAAVLDEREVLAERTVHVCDLAFQAGQATKALWNEVASETEEG